MRGVASVAVTLVVVGCNPDIFGQGSAGPAMPGGGTATSGETMMGDGPTVTASGVGDTTDGEITDPPATGPGGHPEVIISDGPTYDFGKQNLGAPSDHVFTVTNNGDTEASNLQVVGPGDAFMVGGSTCGPSLGPGASCEVTLSFAPVAFGPYTGELEVAFDDAGMAATASRPVSGTGIGITANLVVNGDGESGSLGASPPPGWALSQGSAWATTDSYLHGGARSIWPSRSNGGDDYVLIQAIPVVSLTNWGHAGGLQFHVRAYHRANGWQDDPSWVRFRLGDGTGAWLESPEVGYTDGDSWNEASGTWTAPTNTVVVQIELVCRRDMGTYCSAYFDDIEVWAQYDG